MSFNERLRKARQMFGLSQTDLAQRTGLACSAISHFETGRREPCLANLERLVKAMPGTGALLAGDDDSDPPLVRKVRGLTGDDAALVSALIKRLAR